MTCFRPLQVYRHPGKTPNGKQILKFTPHYIDVATPIPIPCGQCIGCRLERSRQWAIRCSHEASLYDNNCFITLTYNDANLPEDKSLNISHYQKFMKRLRKRFGSNIRFFHCGEYGENFGRPHYHACIFNFDFPDKKLWKVNNGSRLYTSKILEELWPYGYSSIGDVTFQSAAYVARYIMKKINGKNSDSHYEYINPETGEVTIRKQEYTTMSRRPGIGKGWFDKFHKDVYPSDYIVINNKKMKAPKYYDSQFEVAFPDDYATIKHIRMQNAKAHSDNNTPDRLAVRENVQQARLELLKRPLT